MSTGRDQEPARHTAEESHANHHGTGHGASTGQTRFSSHGAIPPVAAHGASGGNHASASDRAFAAMPSGVDLTSVGAAVVIPAGRRLAGEWSYTAQTRSATTVSAEVSHHGISVSMSPGIYLDVTWPGRDCQIDGINLQFGPHAPQVHVSDAGGWGAIPVTGMVQSKISDMMQRGLAHTRLRNPHYDPMTDPDLAGTLQQVVQGFASAFGGAQHANRSGVGLRDLNASAVGASFAMRQPFEIAPGIQIAGRDAHVEVNGDANLQQLANARDNAGRARAAHFESLSLSSSGLDITVHGEAVARIQQLTFHHGGRVTVERFQPLGRLARARHTEATLSALAALIAQAAGSRQGTYALAHNARDPQVVSEVAEAVIAHKVEQALHQMILQHDTAIPGVHLGAALGIR